MNWPMLKKKIIKLMWAVWFAFGHFWFSVIIFNNVAHRSLIAASVLNYALIIFFVIEDRVGDHFGHRLKATNRNGRQTAIRRMLRAYLTSVSFKTALYLFHIFVLVCLAIDSIEPDFFSDDFSLYLLTIEYGLLVLVAGDTFMSQFMKDVSER